MAEKRFQHWNAAIFVTKFVTDCQMMNVDETGILARFKTLRHRFPDTKFLVKGASGLVAMVLGLAAPAAHAQPASDLGEITVGVPASFPPYFQQDADGNPVGFGVDVMEAVAARSGIKTRYRIFKINRENQKALKNGNIDVIPTIGMTKNRLKDFLFTTPVDTYQISLFVRKESIDIKGLEHLGGRPVGAVTPNVGYQILRRRGGFNLKPYQDVSAALFALLSAQIDAFVYTAPVAWKLAREAGVGDRLKVVGKPIAVGKRGIAVAKIRPDLLVVLDKAVKEFIVSNDYRRIYTKWFGAPLPFWTALRVLLIIGGSAVVLLIAMAWWRYYSILKLNNTLKESEERYAHAVAGTNDGIWDWNIRTDEDYFSPRWKEILGYSADEIEPHRDSFHKLLHPDDRDRTMEALQSHFEKRTPYDLECRLRHKQGNYVVVRTKGQAVWDENGRPIRMAGSISDLTEHKKMDAALHESEARLQSVFDSAPFTVVIKDLDFKYILVNKYFQNQFDMRQDELIGHTAYEIFPADRASELVMGDKEAIASRKPYDFKLYIGESVGRPAEVRHVIKFPIINATGDVVAIGSMGLDITDQTRLEEQLRQSQKMEIVGQLTGGVAHDFNNILTAVVGNLELADGRIEGNSEIKSLVERALEATWRGAALTQRLLAFSRSQPLMPQVIDTRVLVEGMDDLLRRTLEETITIEFKGDDNLWTCEADPGQLESAILNLAINARDAMQDGGKLTIEIQNVILDDDYAAAQTDVTPGQYVMVAVTDTGTGMLQEVIDQVFEPFFTTKGVGEGSGLGLSMVYGYVKQSGGHVSVHSEQGVGTTVELYLPRSEGEEATKSSAERSEVPRGRGETILVVEDDPDVLTLSVALLADLGYEVLEATDGPSALAMLETSSRVNLLFTDVVLPGGMRGPELAAEITRRRPGIAVLYTSGYTENAIIHHGRLDDGVELLNKPYRHEELARKVRAAIDESHS